MPLHDCKLRGQNGELLFICSRCNRCYVCRHKAIYLEDSDKWMWRCADGKLREAIFDGRLR